MDRRAFMIISMVVLRLSEVKGRSPVNISNMTTPKLHLMPHASRSCKTRG